MGGTRQAYQHHTEWRKVCIKHTNTTEVYLTSGYIQTSPRRDGCDHTSKWPQGLTSTSHRGVQSKARPRSRQANIDIKHRSKQTNIDIQGNDPNPMIQAQVCRCRPRPWDLNLHPTNKGQNTRKRDIKGQKGYRSIQHSNQHIDLSTQTCHEAHKHEDLSIGMTRGPKRHRSKHKHGKEHIGMQI